MLMNGFFYLMLFSLISVTLSSQSIPEGYILVYQQNFSSDTALKDFRFSNPGSWKINSVGENRFLECSGQTQYVPCLSSPGIMGIIYRNILGEFILEADLMLTGLEKEVRDLCIFFSVKDSSRYYYIHLASQSNDSTHGIFLVKNAPRRRISDWQTEGISWGNQKWHKVRVARNIVNRSVTVYFDNMKNPVMTSRDPELVMGYLGFGSFDNACCIDNIKIWAPTSIPEEANFFEFKRTP
jgi:hypothetical protein